MTFFSSVQELRGECSRVTDMYSHRVSTVRSAGLKSHKMEEQSRIQTGNWRTVRAAGVWVCELTLGRRYRWSDDQSWLLLKRL